MARVFQQVRPNPNGNLLTLEQAAEFLQIAPGTLKHWVQQKQIEHIKFKNLIRFRRSMLEKFADSGTVPPAV